MMNHYPFPPQPIPSISTEQMIEVDRAMIEDFNITLIQMMENAGRGLANLARARFLNGRPSAKKITVLAGTGGNGGGALVAARHLHNYGAKVSIFTTKQRNAFTPIPAHQLTILSRMGLGIHEAAVPSDQSPPDLIIDGLIGYSLKGAPRGRARDLILWANQQKTPTLSLDAPSGVDTTSGIQFEPTIKAEATMTLALPKIGLHTAEISAHVGELYLANISVPPELYAIPSLGLEVGHIFAESDILRLR